MSGRIAKSQIPVRHQGSLTEDARRSLIELKNCVKAGHRLEPFGNAFGSFPLQGPPLPDLSQGCRYFEFDAGQARPGDEMGIRGAKRFVIELNVKSRQIMEIYFTDEHYGKFTFVRIV
jgi:hypothetical protein